MATGDPWSFNVTPLRIDGHIYVTDGTTSVDIRPMTPIGDAYSTSAFISGTSVSLEFYDDSYPDISFTPQTATVGSTSTVNFLPTVMYAWSSDSSGTYPSTLYIWTTDVTADLTDIPYWANYHNGTADDVTSTIVDGNPVWTGADTFEVDGVVYTRDSSKDVVTTTQTVANLSDGTNTYEIEDSQARADIQEIQNNYVTMATLEAIYPVGSVYIGTQATCPMSTVMSGTTWTLVSSGKALWTGDGTNGNTTIAAGLPNITGILERVVTCTSGGSGTNVSKGTGAFSDTPSAAVSKTAPASGKWWNDSRNLSFKASNSNSIYGNSSTVQPPAYVVNVWRRTA